MTRTTSRLVLGALCLALVGAGCRDRADRIDVTANGREARTGGDTTSGMSGRLEAGLRIVTIDPSRPGPALRVHRGDYLQLALSTGGPFTVTIDTLNASWTWPVPDGGAPYLKMTEPGRFPFRLGDLAGTIEVVEYRAAAFREVTAVEAARIIADLHPFVLDVRTPGEFAAGHLEGATLLPIQQMQKRLGELSAHRREPVFVYCHSGNRSTVAAKLLIDAGFEQVINLRRGILDWKSQGLPLVR